jgi:hypothetical protein
VSRFCDVILSCTETEIHCGSIPSELDDLGSSLTEIHAGLGAIEEKLDNSAKLVAVKMMFSTEEGTSTKKNVDSAGQLPFMKVKRYTLTVNPGPLVTAPPGMDYFDVVAGALDDQGVSHQVEVFSIDFSNMSPLPRPGTAVPSFAGTNVFVQVDRGFDGFGTVDIFVNAFVELEP